MDHLVFHVVEVSTSRMAKENRGDVIIHNGKASFSIMLHPRITNISWTLLVTIHAHPTTNVILGEFTLTRKQMLLAIVHYRLRSTINPLKEHIQGKGSS